MLYKEGRKVVLTKYAYTKLPLCTLTINEALNLLQHAHQVELKDINRSLYNYKLNKYGNLEDMEYYLNEEILFTVKADIDNRDGQPIYLVLSIDSQKPKYDTFE